MGTSQQATVYLAELYGIKMALDLIGEQARLKLQVNQAHIHTDNQAAIRTARRVTRSSGQYIALNIQLQLHQLRIAHPDLQITIHWIPAHKGTEGNEMADRAAKEATGWRPLPNTRRPRPDSRWTREDTGGTDTDMTANPPSQIRQLKTTMRRALHDKLQEEWEETWRKEARGRALYRYVKTPSSKTLSLYKGVTKPASSVLLQLRTEKIGLRAFLADQGVPETEGGACQCLWGRQTVHHVLFVCRKLTALRNEALGQAPFPDLTRWLTHAKLVAKVTQFMLDTKLLGQFGATSRPIE
jgi:ribonuclease HI